MDRPKRVFCSHRGVDKAEVEAFARRLREAGVDAWFDQWEIAAGDDIVASMNRGLDACDVGLLFFSSRPWPGKWFDNELSSLVVRRNEDGVRLIPVTIDAGVTLPALLRPLARRGIDQFDQIVDAINGVSRKPTLGPTLTARHTTRFTVRLVGPRDGTIDIVAVRDGTEVARENHVPLTRTLQQSYAEFLQGHTELPTRGPAEARQQSLNRAMVELGQALGDVLFGKRIGEELRGSLQAVSASEAVELCFEASDSTLLALPFEAARLDGAVPALRAGVTVRRIVAGAETLPGRAAASPLKVLVAVGAPDQGRSANVGLDLERELQGILDAVSLAARDGNAEVRFLEVGHPAEIGRALAHDEYHVLHLSGHGGPGSIELEDEDGAAVSDHGQVTRGRRSSDPDATSRSCFCLHATGVRRPAKQRAWLWTWSAKVCRSCSQCRRASRMAMHRTCRANSTRSLPVARPRSRARRSRRRGRRSRSGGSRPVARGSGSGRDGARIRDGVALRRRARSRTRRLRARSRAAGQGSGLPRARSGATARASASWSVVAASCGSSCASCAITKRALQPSARKPVS